MKKFVLLFVSVLMYICSFSQDFLGIKPEGTRSQVVSKFVAKGFRVKPVKGGAHNVTTVVGNYKGTEYEVNVVGTSISDKVWKISVYLPEKVSWYSLKSCYQEYFEILKSKYGEPEKTYEFFSSPYYEGDGYEMTALYVEKCHYFSYWKSVSIEITKWKQVKISYENPINVELENEEKERVNKNIF